MSVTLFLSECHTFLERALGFCVSVTPVFWYFDGNGMLLGKFWIFVFDVVIFILLPKLTNTQIRIC